MKGHRHPIMKLYGLKLCKNVIQSHYIILQGNRQWLSQQGWKSSSLAEPSTVTCRPIYTSLLKELLKIGWSDKCKNLQEYERLYYEQFLLTKTVEFTLRLEIIRDYYLLSLFIQVTVTDHNRTWLRWIWTSTSTSIMIFILTMINKKVSKLLTSCQSD